MNKNKSIEPEITELGNTWLKSYGLDYKLQNASLNHEIDKALSDYFSKSGGQGGNTPDVKLLLHDSDLHSWPILIEYKGYKDKLKKLNANNQVENSSFKGEYNFNNIKSYAVNGAVHYANAILQHTSYTDTIAIGMTSFKNDAGEIIPKIGVYLVSKDNLGLGQKIGNFSDLSFLAPKNFNDFIDKIKKLRLTDEEIANNRKKKENKKLLIV